MIALGRIMAVATAGLGTAWLTVGTATAATPLTAPTATVKAAAAVAAYNGSCGAGYTVVNSADIARLGTVYLTYSATTGENCVVTVRAVKGAAVHMVASLGLGTNTADVIDDGYYTSYAGPVFLDGRGMCMSWRGEINGEVAGKNWTNCEARVR
ncbi:spore-associated protein A [Streptomyces sp. NPDC006552]|uniref:spore-associated protein A n=1 Tax=Streptomyces sp. NPDC006552 TaxID=3157179 RepID=UPI0033B5806B